MSEIELLRQPALSVGLGVRKATVLAVGITLGIFCVGNGALAINGNNEAATRPATQPAKARSDPDSRTLSRLWDSLGSHDTATAREAIWTLATWPDAAAAMVAEKLRHGATDAESLKRLIADLDSKKYAVRKKAFEELRPMDTAAAPALLEALKTDPSVEVRARIKDLLEHCNKPLFTTAATRRMVRAIWTLELIGVGQARRTLERLSKDDARCRTTHLAAAALARLDGRPVRAGKYAPKLRYNVTSRQAGIRLDGSMSFRVRLVNEGNVPAVVYWGDYAYEDMYRFAVTGPGGVKVPVPGEKPIPPGSTLEAKYFREVVPGEALVYNIFLWRGSGRNCQTYYFRRPGKYVVRPGFSSSVSVARDPKTGRSRKIPGAWTGVLKTDPVSVTVEGDPKVLTKGVRLSGQTVDPAGKPVAGVKVVVCKRIQGGRSSYSGGLMAVPVDHAFTDADGRFSFIGLPADSPSFTLRATHPRRMRIETNVVAASPKKEYQTRIFMPRGFTVRGVVVDSSGRPLAGVRACWGSSKKTYTDAHGRFALFGLSGKYVYLWRKGFVPLPSLTQPNLAKGKDWTITIYRKGGFVASGRAVFADGNPLDSLCLYFHLKDKDGKEIYPSAVRTDTDGKFAVNLPRSRTFSGIVIAQPPRDDKTYPMCMRWETKVKNLTHGQRNLKIVFDNRCAIHADVVPTGVLPKSVKFHLTCKALGEQGRRIRPVAVAGLGSEGGLVEFESLCPGRYRISVSAKGPVDRSWHKDVAVGSLPGKRTATTQFVLPEFRFGSVRAMVLEPDGKTPVKAGRVWFGSSAKSGGVNIRDGLVELKEVPVGRIRLETRVKGMAMKRASGLVREGKTTDLGRIIVQRFEDANGLVEGRILYDDGTPALGAALVGDGFRKTPVKADGSYRTWLPAGLSTMVVDLKNAAAWPQPEAGDTILASVQVRPGKTLKRDIILPRRKTGRISVTWKGKAATDLSILLVVDFKDYRLFRTCFRTKAKPGTIKIPDVPPGAKVVRLNLFGVGYSACKEVPAGKKDAVVTFDSTEVGSIAVQVIGDEGNPERNAKLSIKRVRLTLQKPVRGLDSNWWPAGFGRASPPIASTRKTRKDGATVFTGLGPGKYIVQTLPESLSKPKVVEVKPGETTEVRLTIGKKAK